MKQSPRKIVSMMFHHKACVCLLLILLVRSCYSVDRIGGRRVTFVSEPQNWHTAYEICRSQGLQLLTLNNDEECEEAYRLGRKYRPMTSFWLGASDIGHENVFVWMATGRTVISAQWGSRQPDNSDKSEHCIEVSYLWNGDPKWNDVRCHYKKVFFCESVSNANNC